MKALNTGDGPPMRVDEHVNTSNGFKTVDRYMTHATRNRKASCFLEF